MIFHYHYHISPNSTALKTGIRTSNQNKFPNKIHNFTLNCQIPHKSPILTKYNHPFIEHILTNYNLKTVTNSKITSVKYECVVNYLALTKYPFPTSL